MILLLSVFGVFTGLTAGFFGVGGGMVLIPALLFASFSMKQAISISILQMVFTSIYGSFLNFKQNKRLLKDGLILGLGGFFGGIVSGIVVTNADEQYLKYLFLVIVLLAILRVAFSKPIDKTHHKDHSRYKLTIIGFIIGMIAMSIGVGGSIMLTPILVGYMYYSLKDASSMGLFFVVFSSIAGLISLSIYGNVLYLEGSIVGLASLVGVYFGIKLKNIINIKSYKNLILGLYIIILLSVLSKIAI
jgi:uncharacterized membrane protein YfcA